MIVTLRVLAGAEPEQTICVSHPSFLIGRASDCDLRLTCPYVSRHHCELIVEDDCLLVCNTASKNGLFVDGELVEDCRELKSGNRLALGTYRLDVEIEPDPPIALTDPAASKGSFAVYSSSSH